MKEDVSYKLEIENVSNKDQTYHFNLPDQKQGLRWHFPMSFTIKAGQTKTVPIQLDVTTTQLQEGIQQGWLTLKTDNQSFELPYLFVNKNANFPKIMGFEFGMEAFSDGKYEYRLYLPAGAEGVTVDLYNPNTLQFNRTLIHLEELGEGLTEGVMDERNVGNGGSYLANITVTMKDGMTYYKQVPLEIQNN
ncbi:hypothetical protein KO561_17440 [Radiobacillus kanasensis]|nr:FixG Ig-like domain-containing protein [Radiobacillus kanasensis]UFU01443.1 hypothetical protein KO561_17440 [Radiobacillus kanasensis]